MSLADRISAYNRARKWRLFLRVVRPDARTRVLDVGFAGTEYGQADNDLEKRYPFPANVTALGVDRAEAFARRYPEVEVVRYGGGRFPFKDQSFDVCWSNAVIEHVGGRPRQRQFLAEVCRVARIGFVSTPNRGFPVEVHTRIPLAHWLPQRAFDGCARRLGKGWAAGSYMRLLSRRDLEGLLQEAGVATYRIVANRLLGLTLDFVVILGSEADRP